MCRAGHGVDHRKRDRSPHQPERRGHRSDRDHGCRRQHLRAVGHAARPGRPFAHPRCPLCRHRERGRHVGCAAHDGARRDRGRTHPAGSETQVHGPRPLPVGDRVRPAGQHHRRQRQLPRADRLHPRPGRRPAPSDVLRAVAHRQRGLHHLLAATACRRSGRRRVQAPGPRRQGGLDPCHLQPDRRRRWPAGQDRQVRDGRDGRQDPLRRFRGQGRCHQPVAGRDRVRSRRQRAHSQHQLPRGDGLQAGRDQGPAPPHVRG